MTVGFLARLAERARSGGHPATIRPDLPSAYAPGLLARAQAADFEGIGFAGTWPGADPADPVGQDAPEAGARPTGPGRDLWPLRDGAEIAPPPTAGPARVPDRAEPAGSRGSRAAGPEAWSAPDARPRRGPGRSLPDVARDQPRRPPPSGAPEAVGAAPGRPDDPEPARDARDDFTAVRPDQPAPARMSPDQAAAARISPAEPAAAWARAESGRNRGQTVPGSGTGSPAPQTARPPRPGPREPDVHISIGRIEVRLQEAAPAQDRAPGSAQRRPRTDPAMPLEEYLRRRSGTSR